jgi:hypothetical protein
MKLRAYARYLYSGDLYIPKIDEQSSDGTVTYELEEEGIPFDFMGDPSAPRSIIVAPRPYPTTAKILVLKNQYGEEIMPQAEWTITSVEPIVNMWSRVEGYRHQVALSNSPMFGYDDMIRPNNG